MFGQDDFSSDFSSDFTGDKAQSETDDTAFVRRNDTGNDEYDFWAHEPTRAIERITARRPRTAHAETGPRRHGNTREIPLSGNRKAATKPFDADTGLGGQSPAAARRAHAFGPDSNPLLRRVGAMVLLLAFGVPVAMAMRGDDSGRSAFALGTQAAIAAAAAAESTTVASAAAPAAVAPAAVVAAPAAVDAQAAVPAEAPVTAAAPACQKTYTVVVGDGWLRIANKHQVTMQELLAANAATVSTFLLVGNTICVPANAITPTTATATTTKAATPAATQPPAAATAAPFSLACAKKYTVVLGDGWLRIANKHGVAMKEVLAANAANVSTFLMVGRTICVPANATTPTTAKPTTTTVKATPTTKAPRPAPTPTIYPPTRSYTPAEVEAIIREIWPDDLEEEALRIAKRESHLNPRAQNYCCYGLFQIYFNVHHKWLAEMGVTSGEQLLDPTIAAQAGLKLYQRNGWGPWKL